MRLPHLTALAAALAVAACGGDDAPREEPQLPELAQVMPHLPLPPNARLVGRAGSSDALQLTFRSAMETDDVVDYYRSRFTQGDWRLVSDQQDADGVVVLYAERNGPPLWVRVWSPDSLRAVGETLVQIAGGIADTTGHDRQRQPVE